MIDDKFHSEDEEREEQSFSEEEVQVLENAEYNEREVEVEQMDDFQSELDHANKMKKFIPCGNIDLNFDASFYSNRFLEVEQIKTLLKKNSNHGLTGIKNLGNSCYLSTIIQCLSHSLDFCYYMISNTYSKEINNSKTSEVIKKGLSKHI
jgi:ubiquitin C-terminal hydrolase